MLDTESSPSLFTHYDKNGEYWVSVNGSYLILSKVRTKRFVNIPILHRG